MTSVPDAVGRPQRVGGQAHEDSRSRVKWRGLVFLVGFAMGLLSVFVLWQSQSLVRADEDAFAFADMASHALHGEGFVTYIRSPAGVAPYRARRGPSYPMFIAGVFRVVGENLRYVKAAQAALLGLICLLIFEISLRVFHNRRAALISALLYAVNPMILRYVPDIQLEVVLTTLVTFSVWLSLRFIDRPSALRGLCFGLAAAAAALTKPVALPYAALFIATYVGLGWLRRRRGMGPPVPWAPVAAILVGMAVLILPWTYRNYRVLNGYPVLISTNAGGEFIRGYIFSRPDYYLLRRGATTDAEGRANEMESALFAAQGKIWEADEVETDKVLSRAAREQLLSDPLAFLHKACVNFFMFWYVATTRVNSLIVGALALVHWAFAFIGIRRARRTGVPIWPLIVPILAFNLIYAAILALARYSVPIIPCLTVLAGFGIETLLRARSSGAVERTPAAV